MAALTRDPLAFHRQAARWERCRAGFHRLQGWDALTAQRHLDLAAEHDRRTLELEHQQEAA